MSAHLCATADSVVTFGARTVALIFACVFAFGRAETWAENVSPETQPGSPLPTMLKIQWKRGTDLPKGFQDSDGGMINGQLVTVGGFCSGGLEEDNRRKPGMHTVPSSTTGDSTRRRGSGHDYLICRSPVAIFLEAPATSFGIATSSFPAATSMDTC